MKSLFYTLFALLFAVIPAHSAEVWDMPMAYSENNYHTQNGMLFAKAVTLCTGGDITIKVHPGGSLVKGGQIKRAVETGQVKIGERLLSAHKTENPLYGVDSIPLLATSFDESHQLWQAARPAMDDALNKQNLRLLYSVPWSPQGLYCNRQLDRLTDMQGLKLRSYNADTALLAALSGAVPTQIKANALIDAIKAGDVDAFISSGSTGYNRQLWNDLEVFYDVQLWIPRNYVIVNRDAWDILSDQNKRCFESAALLAEQAGTTKAQQLSDGYLTSLREKGMKVEAPNPDFKADLQAIGAAFITEWRDKSGPLGQQILDTYRAR